MILLACIMLFPFFVMVTRSLMTWQEVASIPAHWFPEKINWKSYEGALSGEFLTYLKNTVIVLTVNVFGVVFSAYFVAYGFAKTEFKGKEVIFAFFLSTVMLPGIVGSLALYVTYHKIGWLNTLLPLTVPNLFGGGVMNIFLIRQFLLTVPKSYSDAARVDGANSFQISTRIVMPMVKPVLTLIGVNTFMGSWNDFTGPLMYIDTAHSEKFTLAVGIFQRFRGAVTAGEAMVNVQMAVCTLMMIPCLILFACFQKSLIEGVTLGGIKG